MCMISHRYSSVKPCTLYDLMWASFRLRRRAGLIPQIGTSAFEEFPGCQFLDKYSCGSSKYRLEAEF